MTQLQRHDLKFLARFLHEQAALVVDEDKDYLIQARLLPVVRKQELGSMADLVAKLRANPYSELGRQVVEAMTTNETLFFRDRHPFETLRKYIIPELITRNAESRRLDIWSAACSSGQELYTVAMEIRRHFPDLCRGWKLNLLGSDIDTAVLEQARQGTFNQVEVNRGLPAQLLIKYFHRRGAKWEIDDAFKRMVEFRQINLAKPWPYLPKMDVILLRNVLIYFDDATREAIMRRAHQLLREDGYLMLGGCETAIKVDGAWRVEKFGPTVVYRPQRPSQSASRRAAAVTAFK
ncbi:protein-glutamate O-methyltransferase CheR [Persicimonas caeni]|uniref:protein-glutamate O-methyltransferase n=1 Tax=Persicimonas caeni TaxID=2292766 RepID=A0A4Y6PTF7_PERCE|nr:protein-glutamate O-methyltransferase CheR [Persicimonas caeni]QDG51307.1 protein-glutamate O-methyltransferase CheR [Persicimonas caeni]QED32528.1 protein-glutamate O-methyltransferase CheR [Persicimonas caeni]